MGDLRNHRTCRRCGFEWVEEYGESYACPNCTEENDE